MTVYHISCLCQTSKEGNTSYHCWFTGPQDHGWCAGYTCQKRLSLFHSIVATGRPYDIYFSSVTPQKLRLMMINAKPSEVQHACITLLWTSAKGKALTFKENLLLIF